jgi:hypothetical protein
MNRVSLIHIIIGIGLTIMVVTIGLSIPILVLAEDRGTLKIDTVLPSGETSEGFFSFGKQVGLTFNHSSICPSNHCIVELDRKAQQSMSLSGITSNSMDILGTFRLIDNTSNGHFTPLKQKLVEEMSIFISCPVNDIQEDLKKQTTRYLCKTDSGSVTRVFNGTTYDYTDISGIFDYPDARLILNATES